MNEKHTRKRKPKRRSAGRPAGGSEEVVSAVLDATMEQLTARGLVALRVEQIAKAAGVAKTSIYRRWPTKWKLVRAALLKWRGEKSAPFVSSGDVRADLVKLVTLRAARMQTQEAMRVGAALAAVDDGETMALAHWLYDTSHEELMAVLAAAVERGDLARDADCEMAAENLLALVAHRALTRKVALPRRDVGRAVDLCLYGLGARRNQKLL